MPHPAASTCWTFNNSWADDFAMLLCARSIEGYPRHNTDCGTPHITRDGPYAATYGIGSDCKNKHGHLDFHAGDNIYWIQLSSNSDPQPIKPWLTDYRSQAEKQDGEPMLSKHLLSTMLRSVGYTKQDLLTKELWLKLPRNPDPRRIKTEVDFVVAIWDLAWELKNEPSSFCLAQPPVIVLCTSEECERYHAKGWHGAVADADGRKSASLKILADVSSDAVASSQAVREGDSSTPPEDVGPITSPKASSGSSILASLEAVKDRKRKRVEVEQEDNTPVQSRRRRSGRYWKGIRLGHPRVTLSELTAFLGQEQAKER